MGRCGSPDSHRLRSQLGSHLHDLDALADAVASMRSHGSTAANVIVKLNEGVSGQGNALVDLRGLPQAGAADERTEIVQRLRRMQLECPDTPLDSYLSKLTERGGIVEARLRGRGAESERAAPRDTER